MRVGYWGILFELAKGAEAHFTVVESVKKRMSSTGNMITLYQGLTHVLVQGLGNRP